MKIVYSQFRNNKDVVVELYSDNKIRGQWTRIKFENMRTFLKSIPANVQAYDNRIHQFLLLPVSGYILYSRRYVPLTRINLVRQNYSVSQWQHRRQRYISTKSYMQRKKAQRTMCKIFQRKQCLKKCKLQIVFQVFHYAVKCIFLATLNILTEGRKSRLFKPLYRVNVCILRQYMKVNQPCVSNII